MPKPKMKTSRLIGRIVLIALMLYIGGMVVLFSAIHITGTIDNPEPADAIVVLGAGLSRNGRPGYALTRRSLHAAQLWHQGYADTIICTGGMADNQRRSEADGCLEVLAWRDVPPSAVRLEEQSGSTEENALYAKEILDAHGLESVIIVSDSYHVFRARYIFDSIGIDNMSLSPVPANQIRGYPTYESSIVREVLALHWQVFKTIFNIPITDL